MVSASTIRPQGYELGLLVIEPVLSGYIRFAYCQLTAVN